jgi:hypothetical protein
MAADAWKVYNKTKEYIGDGTIDLDAGDGYFSVILATSSYTPALTHSTYADVSAAEVANGNGYTTGGDFPGTVTWTEASGTVTFDSADPSWTASGGNIVARYAVLVHVAAGTGVPQSTDKIMAYCLLDNTPADVTATDGNAFTIQLAATGYFTVSGGGS